MPGEGAVLFSDGRVTEGLRIVTDTCEKYAVLGSCVALVFGTDGRVLQDLGDAGARSYDDVVKYVNDRAERHIGVQVPTWGLLVYERRNGVLYGIDSDTTEIVYTQSATGGCGGDLALGALSVLTRPKTLDDAVRVGQKAVRAAIRGNAGCGGRVNTLVVKGKRKAIEFR